MKKFFPAPGVLGWRLVAGFLMFAVMTLILGEISEDVRNGEPLTLADAQLSAWLHTHATPPLTTAFRVVTHLGSNAIAASLAVVVGLYLLWKRQPYWLAAVWFSVFGGMALNRFLKLVFQRPRPYFEDPMLTLTGYSFPSGHTMMATVLYGVLAALLVAKTRQWYYRMLVVLSASFLIALVGFSRIYLGAHYLSDVLGAMAEGLAWIALCLTSVSFVWQQRGSKTDSRQ